MAKVIDIGAKFTAIDKFSAPMRKMEQSVNRFTNKARNGIARVERAENKMRAGFSKFLGVLGQVGLAIGLLAIGSMILKSQVELENNLASLSAITGVVGKDFDKFKDKVAEVSKKQKMFGGDTAKAFEIIGSAKPELLKSAAAMGMVTDAAITLKKATGMELADAADALTATMNQFNLSADQASRVINVLSAGSQAGAANVQQISQSMAVFGTVANSLNISVEESTALIETLGDKTIKGAEAGTKLRNVLLTMATVKTLPPKALAQLKKYGVNMDIVSNASLPLEQRLKELSKVQGDVDAMTQIFGKDNVVAGQIILKNVDSVQKYTDAVTGTDIANQQAAINTNTLSAKFAELKASFQNATTSTDTNGKAMTIVKDLMAKLADNMDKVIGTVLIFGGVLIGLKVAFTAVKVAMAIYEGIMWAYNAITTVAGVIQTFFAGAIWATIAPILLVIAAVVAIILIFKNWTKIVKFFGKIFTDIIAWVVKIWKQLTDAISRIDLMAVFRNIGAVLIKWWLMPLRMILKLVSKLPGKIGKGAGEALGKIDDFILKVQGDDPMIKKKDAINTDATVQKVNSEVTKTNNNNNNLVITDNTGKAKLNGSSGNIKLTPNLGF